MKGSDLIALLANSATTARVVVDVRESGLDDVITLGNVVIHTDANQASDCPCGTNRICGIRADWKLIVKNPSGTLIRDFSVSIRLFETRKIFNFNCSEQQVGFWQLCVESCPLRLTEHGRP